jgi:hypothetical protein
MPGQGVWEDLLLAVVSASSRSARAACSAWATVQPTTERLKMSKIT